LIGPGESLLVSFHYGYGPGAKQSQEESVSHSMGDIEPEAAELGEEQSAKRQRASKVEPEIDIHYKSEDKGRDNAKAYQPFSS